MEIDPYTVYKKLKKEQMFEDKLKKKRRGSELGCLDT